MQLRGLVWWLRTRELRWSTVNHGTGHAYNEGCRCDTCREGNTKRARERREYIRSLRKLINGRWVTTISLVQHGTLNGYCNWQCRCVPCTDVHLAQLKVYAEQRRERRDAQA